MKRNKRAAFSSINRYATEILYMNNGRHWYPPDISPVISFCDTSIERDATKLSPQVFNICDDKREESEIWEKEKGGSEGGQDGGTRE